MKKKFIASVLALGLVAGIAYAHNGGYGMGGYANCPGAAAFTNNGNNSWDSASHQKFLNDTVELRQEMNNKRFEYMEARRNPNAGRDQLAAIEKELNDIQLRLQQKAQQYR